MALAAIGLFVAGDADAQTVTVVGDGSRWLCEEVEEDGYYFGVLISASDGSDVRFRRVFRYIRDRSKKLQKVIRRRAARGIDASAERAELAILQTSREDVDACYYDGTTGKEFNPSPTPPDNSQPNPPSNPTPPSNPSADACSVAGTPASVSARIIGGAQCTIGDTPVVFVNILDEFGDSLGGCTGTVVARPGQSTSRQILFAAHCVEGASAIEISTPGGTMRASLFGSHPQWGSTQNTEDYDVALAVFNSNIPTRVAHVLGTNNFSTGERAVIAGYGQDENGNSSEERLKAGDVLISSITGLGIGITYQSGASSSNTCFGDSGGPLFVARGSEWVLGAVTSNGERDDCGPGDHSYFANLTNSAVKAWVNATVSGLIP